MKGVLVGLVAGLGLLAAQLPAEAQQFVVKPVAEKKIAHLPQGPLYWRVENFGTIEKARAAAGPSSLPVEAVGRAWLFTLGPSGGSTPGGSKVAEIGPVPPIAAPEYLLRINLAGGPPGAKTPVHTHPGSEAFYIVTGRLSQRLPQSTRDVVAGAWMNGQGPDTPMVVMSSGSTDLQALVMFVVDATKPFSSHASIQ
jgi:hypothetical protein